MRNLIPKIEIGKRYLMRQRVSEDPCPQCGALSNSGNPYLGQGIIVTAMENMDGAEQECDDCGFVDLLPSGYFRVAIDDHPDNCDNCAAYTALSRLPDEHYEEEL